MVVSSFIFRAFSISLSVGCLLAAGKAWAEAAEAAKPSPSLVITLDGGLPANNLARLMAALADEKVLLRTLAAPVSPGTRVCDLLTQAQFPPPCGDFLPHIGRLNPGINLNFLGGVTTLTLPDVKIEVRSAERYFTRTVDTPVVMNSLVRNWATLKAQITESRGTEIGVQYDRYIVQLFPDRPDEVIRAARIAANLKLKNLTIEAKGIPTGNSKLYGNPDEEAKSDCESDNFIERLKIATRKYVHWFDRDSEAEKFLVEPVEKVRVLILDTPIIMGMPNLDPTFNGASAARLKCKWAYDRDKHHGNHLASIIASRNNGTGFFGIEPSAQLGSFNIQDPSVDTGAVADYVEKTRPRSSPSIYLFATGLPVRHLVDESPNWRQLSLLDKNTRSSDPLFRTVSSLRPLFVVAAGQRDVPGQSLELSATTNLFPQNLGDFPNVIVVTACRICKRGSAELLPEAFSSEGAPKFVHVAAPGGTPIPAWTSESSIGAAFGTSQAAAYVAGVAAGMLSRYPNAYREPGQLKYRLQVCSYPLPAATPSRRINLQPSGLSAGVVDPTVCLLDPTQTWVKQAGSWMSVKAKGWAEQTLFFRGKRKLPLSNEDVMRVVRTKEAIIPDTGLALYVNRKDGVGTEYEVERGLGQVMLVRAGAHAQQAALTLCDNTTLPLSKLDDVILATDPAPCQSVEISDGSSASIPGG
jgi:hypothetical protein